MLFHGQRCVALFTVMLGSPARAAFAAAAQMAAATSAALPMLRLAGTLALPLVVVRLLSAASEVAVL